MVKRTFEVWCLVCCGGGKVLGLVTSQRAADRLACSHNGTYGHATSVHVKCPTPNPKGGDHDSRTLAHVRAVRTHGAP
jgi:hypothetical protein